MDQAITWPERFESRTGEDELHAHERSWRRGCIPRSWLKRFRQPVVILSGGFSLPAVTEAAEDALGLHLEDGILVSCSLSESIATLVDEEFDRFPKRALPPATYQIRPGGLEAWRAGLGHFLAYPCNGCGEIVPGYWLETPDDVRRALAIECSHPAIPFMGSNKAQVLFEHEHFSGCYCSRCLDGYEVCEMKERRRASA